MISMRTARRFATQRNAFDTATTEGHRRAVLAQPIDDLPKRARLAQRMASPHNHR